MASNSQAAAVAAPRPQPVRPDLIPPRGAKPVGHFADGSATGKVIYEMDVMDTVAMKAGKTQALDPVTGEPLWHKHPTTGEKQYPVWQLPKPIMRRKRFILRGYKTGAVRMVERFEESPEEVAERVERERVAAFSNDLALEAVRRGFDSASAMMSSLFGDDVLLDGETEQLVEEATPLIDQFMAEEQPQD